MNLPNRYKPTGLAFGGGQGIVTVWDDLALGRKVAVKRLQPGGMGGSLREEAALLGKVQSKHVVELYALEKDPSTGEDYMIMEYVDGKELIGYEPASSEAFCLTMYQISAGLTDIHGADCMHRDIKPPNLKVDNAGIVKIIDFGIGAPTRTVNTNQGRGSDGYRGPEYFYPPTTITTEADVYALGALACEFCCGSLHPSLLKEPPESPPSFTTFTVAKTGAALHPELSRLFDSCLSQDPTKRPKASQIRGVLAKHILRGKHVASFVHSGQVYRISNAAPAFRINGYKGSFNIVYDGLDFVIRHVTGDVFINRSPALDGSVLPDSCVITIGQSGPRNFIPINVSHPGVVL